MARLRALIAAAAFLALPGSAHAKEAAPLDADPALEARVMAIAEELRCLVCQNETLAASQADLAVDLRKQIRLQLKQGRSQPQIIDFMTARYGEFVRYRPAFGPMTALLWAGPFVLLVVAGFVLRRNVAVLRARRGAVVAAGFSADEERRLNELLGPGHDPAGARLARPTDPQ
jgi:cytochrome c-type biogenesis protein CcmH